MSPKTILRSIALLLAAVSVFTIRIVAQDAPSVAEAARRTRQQKQDSAKPAHVIDNDSIPPSPSASATPTNPGSDSNAAPPAENSSIADKPSEDPTTEQQKKAEIESLKQQIAEKQEKVNLQQRELALAQDTYYGNVDHEHDKAGKTKLDSMQTDLTQAQTELAHLQAKLASLAPASDTKAPEPAKP
ncbi:MAG TPA: hypothetical protein VJX72_14545 [Candidatus Acidoferrum sp.]|nr:hypothetical protein [Candidatus Acidoferrum sp.]